MWVTSSKWAYSLGGRPRGPWVDLLLKFWNMQQENVPLMPFEILICLLPFPLLSPSWGGLSFNIPVLPRNQFVQQQQLQKAQQPLTVPLSLLHPNLSLFCSNGLWDSPLRQAGSFQILYCLWAFAQMVPFF